MSAPDSPLEKKISSEEKPLTLEERIGRLEIALENAYNVLARELHRVEMTTGEEKIHMEGELTRTLTLMNMSTLQNIVTIRVLAQKLIDKGVVSAQELEESVSKELKVAVEAQQKAMQQAKEAHDKAAAEAQLEVTGATEEV